MKNDKTVLVLGGTGAMGVYLVPKLIEEGYSVDVTSRSARETNSPKIKYIIGDAMSEAFIKDVLKKHYDAIIDFMIYPSSVIKSRAKTLVSSTDHYIFLSSYRVYGNMQTPITESAPQLIDMIEDKAFLNSDDYSIQKSNGERALKSCEMNNWTIVRPAITYSKHRFQLVTLEAVPFVTRALQGKTIVFPEEAFNVQATMTWAGDVAKMIAGLVGNERAFGESFTVSTAEHHTWGEIAEYYRNIIGLKTEIVDKEAYLSIIAPNGEPERRWQLDYDRLFDRIVDNSKILSITGLKQENFMRLYDGLKMELEGVKRNGTGKLSGRPNDDKQMDIYFGS